MRTAGIEIDADAVRVCSVDIDGDETRVCESAEEPLGAAAVVQGVIQDGGAVVAALRRSVERIEAEVLTLGYAANDAVFKAIEIPKMTEAELAEQISWEAEQHVPFDIKDCALEYRVVQERRDLGQMTVLLTAMRTQTLDALVALAKEAGVAVSAVELPAEALLRLHRLLPPAEAEPYAWIATMADRVVMAVARGGELVMARECGASVDEIRMVLDFAAATGDAVCAATLVGSQANAMLDPLSTGLEIPVSLWSPPESLATQAISPSFGVAVGLALPGPETERVGAPAKKRGLLSRLFGAG